MPPSRADARAIWDAAVAAAGPFGPVRDFLADPGGPARRALTAGGGVYVFGGGKAAPLMAQAVEAALPDHLDRLHGILNVPEGDHPPLQRLHLWPARPAGSNHPTDDGVRGVEMQLAMAELLRPEDLALCLLSGGGSALLPAPVEGVTLEDKQAVTRLLHNCGATIDEMNCVRKHLSRFKGGRLAATFAAAGCRAVSLIVSDVVGDPLDVIASGPTAADPTTFADALAVLARFDLLRRAPPAVVAYLRGGHAETPKALPATQANIVLCNNRRALDAAARKAESLGYRVLSLGSFIEGETRPVAVAHAGIVRSILHDRVPLGTPVCLLSGGETTVTLGPNPGKGGRNQEFVLACWHKLGPGADVTVLSGGTDGEDGPTDAAGAVADAETWKQLGTLNPADHLARHDAYPFFDAAGGLVKTGLTGTNVMDVRVILIGAKAAGV